MMATTEMTDDMVVQGLAQRCVSHWRRTRQEVCRVLLMIARRRRSMRSGAMDSACLYGWNTMENAKKKPEIIAFAGSKGAELLRRMRGLAERKN